MLGTLLATKKWRRYYWAETSSLKLIINHSSILLEQLLYTEARHTWLLKLLNYKYTVKYKKEKDNITADSLSRRGEEESSSLLAVLAVESDWVSQVRKKVESDDYSKRIKTKLEEGKLDPGKYQLKSGLVYFKGRILINPTSSLTQILITKNHDTPAGGSFRI